ncbi:MerR family transcriptional regulator [Micropruina sp.]|uniref:MerR family transcriptional regulator n=1 Tax=Micropruina sp. TaxID=2737536 RepID=UPI0039E4E169
MKTTGATISQAADALDLTADTLRYYERDNLLLRTVPREPNGHRRYQEADLHWIELITRLRATGMPIRDIRQYAALVRAGDGNETERLELLRRHRRRVLAQLAAVTVNLAAIDHKIALYDDRLEQRALSA